MNNSFLLIELLTSLITPALMLLFSTRFPPEWAGETKNGWKKINIIAAITSIISSIIFIGYTFFIKEYNFYQVAMVLSIAMLVYNFVQALYTDFEMRLVDGRLQYLTMLCTGVINYYAVKDIPQGHSMINIMIIFAIVGLALNFLMPPSVLGAADFRAFVILTTTIIPLIGYQYFSHSIIIFLICAILYSVIKTYQRDKNEKHNILLYFMTKISIPAVPFIIGSGLFVIIYSLV